MSIERPRQGDGRTREARSTPRRSRRDAPGKLAAFLLVIASVTCVRAAADHRAGLLPDSVTYLDMAEQLAAGHGVSHRWAYWEPVYQTGQLPTRSTLWPPGYPLTIAAATHLGLGACDAARLVSVLAMYLLPLALFALGRQFVSSGWAALGAACGMACFPLYCLAGFVMAEPLFLLIVTVMLATCIRAAAPSTMRAAVGWLLPAGCLAGAAFLVRLPGAAALAPVGLAAVFAGRRLGRRRVTTVALLLAGVGPVAMAIGWWVVRSMTIAGAGAAPFHDGPFSLLDNVAQTPRAVLSEWLGWKALLLGNWELLRPVQLGALVTIGLCALAAAVPFPRRKQVRSPGEAPSLSASHVPGPPASAIVVAFLAAYALLVTIASAGSGLLLEPRYVNLLIPIALVWLVARFHPAISSRAGRVGQWAGRLGVLACLALAVMQTAVCWRWATTWQDESYVVAARDSPVIAWLAANASPGETLLTTTGAEIALYRPNPVLQVQKRPHASQSTESWDDVDRLARRFAARWLIHRLDAKPPNYDPVSNQFLATLDHPERFAERDPIILGGHVVYRLPPAGLR